MEIAEIKQRLSLSEVIRHYGLKADKQNRLRCPFHEDKTPSMQLYYKTQTAYCFSSNCRTHGKSMDVIDFVMYKENVDKHQAIEKCIALVDNGQRTGADKPAPATKEPGLDRSVFLESMFQYFCNAVSNSKHPNDAGIMSPRTGEVGWTGVTQTPGSEPDKYNSTDGNVKITVNSGLSEKGQAQTFAHEGYGHGFLYSLGLFHKHNVQNVNGKMKETNETLKQQIIDRIDETEKNQQQK